METARSNITFFALETIPVVSANNTRVKMTVISL